MKRVQLVLAYVILIGVGLAASRAFADNEGRNELDEATQLKVSARNLSDLEKVVELCETAIKKGLDEGNTQFATQLLSSTLYEYSDRITKAIFERNPPNPRWPLLRNVALENLTKAVKYDPKLGDAYLLIAKLQVLPGGSLEKANEATDKALKAFKDDKKKLASVYVLRSTFVKGSDKKLESINKAIELDATNTEAMRIRALLYLATGKYEEASKAFDKILESDEGNVGAHQAAAEALVNIEKYDAALKHANRAVELKPDSAANYTIRARIYAAQEKLDESLADLNQAIRLQPNGLGAVLFRARIHLAKSDVNKAKNDVDRVLQLQPNLPQGLLLRSLISSSEKRYAAAISDMRKVLQTNPQNPQWRIQLGSYYSASGRPRKAVEVFTDVIKEDAKNIGALRARGDALLSYGQHRDAVEDYEKGLEIEPKHTGILNNLAWVLATSPDDSLRDGKRSIELAKTACEETEYKAAHILSTLAAGYAESGDFETAIKWSTKAVELGKEGDVVDHLRDELKSYKNGKAWREKQETEEKPDVSSTDLET